MSRITSKGQITIPQSIRNSFSMLPGTFVDVVVEDNKVVLVKKDKENKFTRWLGRGKDKQKKNEIDWFIDGIRGRVDE